MILHLENGRIGNQLLQYVGLKKYFPKEKIYFLGRKSIDKFFDNVYIHFISIDKLNQFIPYGIVRRILFFLSNIRVIGKIKENQDSKTFKLILQKGLFWKIFLTDNIFFQHKDFLNQINKTPILKPRLINKSLKWLKKRKINININPLVFVHIRRGDYKKWPSKKFPAVLNLNWYKRAMNLIKKKINNPIFIIITDDKYYTKKYFKESKKLLISNNVFQIDLSIMSLCHSGILSASSFSWWGAFFAKKNKKKNFFIAPKNWAGHRLKKMYPKNFYTSWLTYID